MLKVERYMLKQKATIIIQKGVNPGIRNLVESYILLSPTCVYDTGLITGGNMHRGVHIGLFAHSGDQKYTKFF